MKYVNKDYSNIIVNNIINNINNIVEVQKYNLDDLTSIINNLKDNEKESIIEEIINNQLMELKNFSEEIITKYFNKVDEVTDYFIKFYNNNYDIANECDLITTDLVLKNIGRNGRKLDLPINLKYLKEYCLSSNIDENQLYDSLVWIALRLITINYFINSNN